MKFAKLMLSLLVTITMISLPSVSATSNSNGNAAKICNNASAAFNGSFTLTKSVDTNYDGAYNDANKLVDPGNTVRYKINWKFNQGQDPLQNPYLYDTIPTGTTYYAGSMSPTYNLSYSFDNGATWTNGEPPTGSPAGTQLRWNLSNFWRGAGSSPYVGSANPQPSDINISNNTGLSYRPKIAMDPDGYPGVVWYDTTAGNYEIFFARWNGTKWVNAAGSVLTTTNGNISNNTGSSYYPSLAFDKLGKPCVTWFDSTPGNYEIYYARWDGTNWANAAGAALTSTNGNVSNNTGSSYYPIIAIDQSNRPCITWHDLTPGNYEVYFARWDGTTWVNSSWIPLTSTNGNVSNNTGTSYYPVIALDSSDNPNLAWYDSTPGNYEIYYAKWDGSSWVTSSGAVLTTTNANISNNSGTSYYPTIALDSSGKPNIVWSDFTPGNYEIYYARWDGSTWLTASGAVLSTTNANVSNNTGTSYYPSIALDSSGNPRIAWYDSTPGNYEIYYARWNGLAWVNATGDAITTTNPNISNNTGSSYNPIMVLDSSGNPNIVWYDLTPGNYEIYFVRLAFEQQFYFSVKINDPALYKTICNQATFRHALDSNIPTYSNSVCIKIHVKEPVLEVTKTAGSSSYNLKDTFDFTITVKNTGDADATDVALTDAFPKEIEFVSSTPSGSVGLSGIKYSIGTLTPGAKESFKLKFKLASNVSIQNCLTIINDAIATSGTLIAKDNAVINVCANKAPGEMFVETNWSGLEKGVRTSGQPVRVSVLPRGGSSPYSVKVEWGDGSPAESGTVRGDSNPFTSEHTFSDSGEFTVKITCVDAYGSTRIVTKTIK